MNTVVRRKTILWLMVPILCVIPVVAWDWLLQIDKSSRIVRARKELQKGQADSALKLLEPLQQGDSVDGTVRYLAAEAFTRKKEFDSAVREYSYVAEEHERYSAACFRAGDILLLQLYRPSEAENFLRRAATAAGEQTAAEAHLAALYGLCGLTSLTTDLRVKRLRSGSATEVDLVLLALGDTAAENSASIPNYQKAAPDDPLTLLALAHQAWQHHNFPVAKLCYEKGLAERPDVLDACVRLGRTLIELGDYSAFVKWHENLPDDCEEFADLWSVRGDYSRKQDDLPGAIRCYWEAARRDPTNRSAHHQLGQSLASLGQTQAAMAFQRRNEELQQLLLAAKQYNTEPSAENAIRTAISARECGHVWEAWSWAEILRNRFPGKAAALLDFRRPSSDSPRVEESFQPALQTTFGDYPLPRWMTSKVAVSSSDAGERRAPGSRTPIRFEEESELAGLRFSYQHGDKMPGPGMRMFQFSGGGIGAVDYDQDGWPDLYLTQGGDWPLEERHPPSDQLYRNQSGTGFTKATDSAGIVELNYSQGVTVGDYNADGWPDIFVANVNENTLFQNNGDGTFSDVTLAAEVTGNAWSTSVACADFNGDALPDFYVVNYLTGADLLSRICHQADGTPRACTPHEFDAAEDQLLLNLGDGKFVDVTAEAGVVAPGGKGLGVIAADFDESGRISLFVGNDTTANFFFQNQTSEPGDTPRFTESAVLTGLAFDREGRTQACMGIAAGDADGDQRLDLFVTNYFNESNTLYTRLPGTMFSDSTSEANLKEPSIRQLGFGTQFLDADLDGWSDLVVTNGHVDDDTARGIPLHMPTQFFHNAGSGQFNEVPLDELGPWFRGKYLGRALTRIDWNGDGCEDFVVGNLDSPTALLTNRTANPGNFVVLRLVGTVSAREPIGTAVNVTLGDKTISNQLLSGDGYQSSNERQLIFGIGDCDVVDIEIRWPSGTKQKFRSVLSSTIGTVVEGRDTIIHTVH